MSADRRLGETSVNLRPPATAGTCDVCGGPTYEVRCKAICRCCGYTRDCSDP